LEKKVIEILFAVPTFATHILETKLTSGVEHIDLMKEIGLIG